MNLSERMDTLEKTVIDHLKESGEIRTDLKWLKKSYWALAGIGCMAGGTIAADVVLRLISR